jgi:hypothetical protein
MRKINFKNIALVIGVSIFDIAIGAYDRIVNNTGFVKGVSDWYSGMTAHTVTNSPIWNQTQLSLATTTQSGYSLSAVVVLVVVSVAILGVMFTLVGARSA